MTEDEARDIARMAKGFMPKSPPEQVVLLEFALQPHSAPHAEQAISELAQRSEFISVPDILSRVRQLAGDAERSKRQQAAYAEAIIKREAEATAKQRSVEELNAARTFCREHEREVEAWAKEAIAKRPWLEETYRKRGVIASPVLACFIYKEFAGEGVRS